MNQMRLYIFDMGGVVASNTDVFPSVFNHLKITAEQFYGFAGSSLGRLMDGGITAADFWRRFSSRSGQTVSEELFAKFFNPRLDLKVVAILKQLKDNARVICGTNTFDSHYDYLMLGGYYDLFDAVYASNKMGVSKPHRDFYRYILKSEGVKPEDTVFIDDTEKNVVSAEKLGIHSIWFKDAVGLRSDIERHLNQNSAG
jgi:putative hydrolase of the HAD superfamily